MKGIANKILWWAVVSIAISVVMGFAFQISPLIVIIFGVIIFFVGVSFIYFVDSRVQKINRLKTIQQEQIKQAIGKLDVGQKDEAYEHFIIKAEEAVRQANVNEAIKLYDEAIMVKSWYFKAWLGKARLLQSRGNYRDALKNYDEALITLYELDEKPSYSDIWTSKAEIYLLMGKKKKVIDSCRKALEIDSTNQKAKQLLTRVK